MQFDTATYRQRFSESLNIKSRSEQTKANYLSHFLTFCRDFPYNIPKATTAQLTEYISSAKSRSMMAQRHTMLKLFYKHVLKQPNKVSKWIPYPEKTRHLPNAPTHAQVMQMIELQTNTKHKLIIRLLYATGLRVSELCNLKWSDVKREKGENPLSIHVVGKGKKDRYIPLSKETFDLLYDYCKEYNLRCDSKTHYIFGDSEPYSIRSVQKVVERAGDMIGWERLHPHKLRHSFGLEQRKSNLDLGRLQELMGHSSLEVTRQYAGVDNLNARLLL